MTKKKTTLFFNAWLSDELAKRQTHQALGDITLRIRQKQKINYTLIKENYLKQKKALLNG